MLLFDDGKKLEKAVGEEAAKTIVEVLERFDESQRSASASKGDPIIAVGRVEPHDYEGKTYINFIADWASVGAQRTVAIIAAIIALMK